MRGKDMQRIIFTIFCATIMAYGCKSKQKIGKEPIPTVGDTVATKPIVPTPKPFVREHFVDDKGLVFFFSRTPCFGKCPVYSFKLYDNGQAFYEGAKNVVRIGKYSTTVPVDFLKKIELKADELGFKKLENEYPVPGKPVIYDFPSCVSYLFYGKGEKMVESRHDIPEELLRFQKTIDEMIESLEWKSTEVGKGEK